MRVLQVLVLFSSMFAWQGCVSLMGDSEVAKWQGEKIYNRVNFRAQWRDAAFFMYSTNHYGVPKLFPLNTAFIVKETGGDEIILTELKKNNTLRIRFIEKHHGMSFERWLKRVFSTKPVSLPEDLTKLDREKIAQGVVAVGMSRRAVFLAIGYPPASLTVDDNNGVLTYEKKRFNKTKIIFDSKDTVKNIEE